MSNSSKENLYESIIKEIGDSDYRQYLKETSGGVYSKEVFDLIRFSKRLEEKEIFKTAVKRNNYDDIINAVKRFLKDNNFKIHSTKGAFRLTYISPNGELLKVARNNNGVSHNNQELALFNSDNIDIFPKVEASGLGGVWFVVEKLNYSTYYEDIDESFPNFEAIFEEGIASWFYNHNIDDFNTIIKTMEKFIDAEPRFREYLKDPDLNFKKIYHASKKYGIEDLHYKNVVIVDNEVKIIDGGFSEESVKDYKELWEDIRSYNPELLNESGGTKRFFWAGDRPDFAEGMVIKKWNGRPEDDWEMLEAAFEKVRKEIAPNKPSRLGCTFVCSKLESFCSPDSPFHPYIYLVETSAPHFEADGAWVTEAMSNWGGFDFEQAMSYAKHYWKGEKTSEKYHYMEVIVGGDVKIIKPLPKEIQLKVQKLMKIRGKMGDSDTLNESQILTEGRYEDVQAKYPELDEKILKFLSENDPSKNNKYLMWMTKEVSEGHNVEDIVDLVKEFHKGGKFSSRDINSYDFDKLSQEVKQKLQKKDKNKISPEDADIVYEDEQYIIHKLKTYKGSMLLGMGTKWCISGKDDEVHWKEYSEAKIDIFTVLSKSRKGPQFPNGELQDAGDPNYKIAIVFEPEFFTDSRVNQGQWAYSADVEKKYGSEIADAQDKLLAGNYMKKLDPVIAHHVEMKFRKLGPDVVERMLKRVSTPVPSTEEFMKSFFGAKLPHVLAQINKFRRFPSFSEEELMDLYRKAQGRERLEEDMKETMNEAIQYTDKHKQIFLQKWEKEGKPYKEEIGENGENFIDWVKSKDPSKGKYTGWMVKQYVVGDLHRLEDIASTTADLLTKHLGLARKKKLKPEHRDINRFKTTTDLFNALSEYNVEDEDLLSRNEVEQAFYKNGEAVLIHNGNEWKVINPKTEKASCYFGTNTKWCTAAQNDNRFSFYNKDGPLYIFLHKKSNKRFQFHLETNEFMNELNEPIKTDVLQSIFTNKELFNTFKTILPDGAKPTKKGWAWMVEDKQGGREWFQNGKLHRDNGPAYVSARGAQEWWQNGKQHRDNGPAVVRANGVQEWWQNGRLHRDDGPAVVHAGGYQAWFQNGELHRDNGPAVVKASGDQEWYQNGELHRDDGPAYVGESGYQAWYQNGYRHRDDGPAIVHADGTQEWYQNGELHRDNGPAVVKANGAQEWWQNGKFLRDADPAVVNTLNESHYDMVIDLEYYKKSLNESYMNQFVASVKHMLLMMFGWDNFKFLIKGNKKDVENFAVTLGKEKSHLKAVSKYGLDDARTYKSQAKLANAIRSFEKETGLKWPVK